MERYQVRLLAVVEETGAMLGVVSEDHILAAWGEDPLRPVSEVMATCGSSWEEEEEDGIRLLRAVELLEARLEQEGVL